jgi:hypothetical protein
MVFNRLFIPKVNKLGVTFQSTSISLVAAGY